MQETTNFFGKMKDPLNYNTMVMKSAALVPKKWIRKAAKFIPFASEVLGLIEGFAGLFTVESDWKSAFAKEFANLIPETMAKSKTQNIGNFLKTVKDCIPIINATICNNTMLNANNGNGNVNRHRMRHPRRNRKNPQQEQLNLLNKRLENLEESRPEPITAEPLAMQLNKNLVSNFKLSCKLRDIIWDYLPFVVAARLEATTANFTSVSQVRNAECQPNGYNKTNILPCAKFNCETILERNKEMIDKVCLVDGLS